MIISHYVGFDNEDNYGITKELLSAPQNFENLNSLIMSRVNNTTLISIAGTSASFLSSICVAPTP